MKQGNGNSSDYTYSGNMGETMVTQTGYVDQPRAEAKIKNLKGNLGLICNYCAGLGFTNSIGGSSMGCQRCQQTGVEPPNMYELAEKVDKLVDLVNKLLKKK